MSQNENDKLERALLALPREVESPRNLWPGIQARIEAKRRQAVLVRRGAAGSVMLLAAAAVLLSIRAHGPQPLANVPPAPITSEKVAIAPAPPPTASDMPPRGALVPEEASYLAALGGLETSLQDRLKQLPAKDGAAVGASLRALDVAISTTRASLVDHPDDADLRAELDAEYDQKIDVMNDVLDWTTRS